MFHHHIVLVVDQIAHAPDCILSVGNGVAITKRFRNKAMLRVSLSGKA